MCSAKYDPWAVAWDECTVFIFPQFLKMSCDCSLKHSTRYIWRRFPWWSRSLQPGFNPWSGNWNPTSAFCAPGPKKERRCILRVLAHARTERLLILSVTQLGWDRLEFPKVPTKNSREIKEAQKHSWVCPVPFLLWFQILNSDDKDDLLVSQLLNHYHVESAILPPCQASVPEDSPPVSRPLFTNLEVRDWG